MRHFTADQKPLNVLGVVTVPLFQAQDSFGVTSTAKSVKFRVASGLNYHCILGTEGHQALCHDYLKIPRHNQIICTPQLAIRERMDSLAGDDENGLAPHDIHETKQ